MIQSQFGRPYTIQLIIHAIQTSVPSRALADGPEDC